jgi:hypothetical protein
MDASAQLNRNWARRSLPEWKKDGAHHALAGLRSIDVTATGQL